MEKIGWCILIQCCIILGLDSTIVAQTVDTIKKDTTQVHILKDITVVGRNSKSDYQQMPEIVGTNIYAGKKNALIVLENVQGNIATNNMRQVLAKVPGIHVWESDPSGIQIGIAARGLSPNRSWEFNVRQNGYDIAADPFGYPEAYYNPQLQAVQRIEIIRGQGALQYGPQFGGLVNYILKNGSDINKPIEFETQQTIGSHKLYNRFYALGGKKNKINYYSFLDFRNGDGWRANSQYFTKAGFGSVTYQMNNHLSLSFELMHSQTRSQQPGGLTDYQFYQNAQQSFRARNWFDITWFTPAISIQYKINEQTQWNTKIFGTIGDRNSIGYLQPITIKDSVNILTQHYNNRLVHIDRYRNYGIESRFISHYKMRNLKNSLSGGVRLYTGTTQRLADGKGSTNLNYDINIIGTFPKDIVFESYNIAAFIENIFRISNKLYLIPGIRFEWIAGVSSGKNGYTANGSEILLQDVRRNRNFTIAGIGLEYHVTPTTEVYANISQAYRPIQFANLQAPPSTDIIDQQLKDASGYNLDIGYRGKVKNYLHFDVSAYRLQYNNRVGAITPAGANYRFITNVGASSSKGIEAYIEFNPLRAFSQNANADIILFGSYAHNNSRYSDDHKDATTKGKKVENAPAHILRTGLTIGYKKFLFTTQYSFVSSTFSDANNTTDPIANGTAGLIPSYAITDITTSYKFYKNIQIKAGINNIWDSRYFTRRAGGYPGPGLMPGDGRTYFVSVGTRL